MGSSGAAVGGGIGAAVGSIIPGIGTALGGAIGGLVGFITNLFGSGYDVTASQLPTEIQNQVAFHRSFDTQKEHDDYVVSVWQQYAQQNGLSAADVQRLQSTVGVQSWADQAAQLGLSTLGPRNGPPAVPPRRYPGGSPRGNTPIAIRNPARTGLFPQAGPQPTPPNTHYPGGTRLHRRRRVRRRHHASSHL